MGHRENRVEPIGIISIETMRELLGESYTYSLARERTEKVPDCKVLKKISVWSGLSSLPCYPFFMYVNVSSRLGDFSLTSLGGIYPLPRCVKGTGASDWVMYG